MHLPHTLSSSQFCLRLRTKRSQQTSMFYSYIVTLKSVFLQDSCQSFYGLGWLTWCQDYLKMRAVGEGPGAILWVLRHFLSLISSLLVGILEKAMAPHSSTLAWKIPRTEGPGGLQSMGLQRVGHNWATSLQRLYNNNVSCVRTISPSWKPSD